MNTYPFTAGHMYVYMKHMHMQQRTVGNMRQQPS